MVPISSVQPPFFVKDKASGPFPAQSHQLWASCDRLSVAGYAAMATIKLVMPIQLDKYDALFRYQTKDFSAADITAAMNVAEPVVSALVSSR